MGKWLVLLAVICLTNGCDRADPSNQTDDAVAEVTDAGSSTDAAHATDAGQQPDSNQHAPETIADADASPSTETWIVGAQVWHDGAFESLELKIAGTKIAAVVAAGSAKAAGVTDTMDFSGHFITPAWIDSHVHIVYTPGAKQMLDGGVAGVVDHAAPVSFFDAKKTDFENLRVIGSGPMLTAPGGYPLNSWGKNGYGIPVGTAEQAEKTVDELFGLGAKLVKIPLAGGPTLSEKIMKVAVARAHNHKLPVSMHALGDAEALLAAKVGADVLAHCPTSTLTEQTVKAWANGVVVSTLSAFVGAEETVANLKALRAAGATVLYGTDFGNTSKAGIDGDEVALLVKAGLSGAEILAAATNVPADFWGFEALGRLEAGMDASVLVYAQDPTKAPEVFEEPLKVVVLGGF